MIAWSTLFDAENVFRLLPVGVPRSMEEKVPQKNHFRLLSDNKQRGLYSNFGESGRSGIHRMQNASCLPKVLADAKNVFRLLSVGVPRSIGETAPQKNHFRLLSDSRQRSCKEANAKMKDITSVLGCIDASDCEGRRAHSPIARVGVFFSMFRDLQDLQTFAPLRPQNFSFLSSNLFAVFLGENESDLEENVGFSFLCF